MFTPVFLYKLLTFVKNISSFSGSRGMSYDHDLCDVRRYLPKMHRSHDAATRGRLTERRVEEFINRCNKKAFVSVSGSGTP